MEMISEVVAQIKKNPILPVVEEILIHMIHDYGERIFNEIVSAVEKEVIQEYLEDGWEIDRLESRQMTFIFGDVTFQRRRLRKSNEKSMIPLDAYLGIEPRSHYSPLVKERVGKVSTKTPYRIASEIISLFTTMSISHQTIHKIVKELGSKIEEQKGIELEEETEEKKTPEVLFIEGDGVYTAGQGSEKRHEIHRFVMHEGVDSTKKRPTLINSVMFTSLKKGKDALKELSLYLEGHYNLKNTLVISNSDCGSGYETEKFYEFIPGCKRHEHFIDSYHVNRKIKEDLNYNPELQKKIRFLIKTDYDIHAIKLLLDTEESMYSDKDDKKNNDIVEKIKRIRSYIEKNWEVLKPARLRGLPEELVRIGICESGHRIITYRMKRQGKSWTKEGALHMVNLITALYNGTYEGYLRSKRSMEDLRREEENPEKYRNAVRNALKQPNIESIGVRSGSIPLNDSANSSMGHIRKIFGNLPSI